MLPRRDSRPDKEKGVDFGPSGVHQRIRNFELAVHYLFFSWHLLRVHGMKYLHVFLQASRPVDH